MAFDIPEESFLENMGRPKGKVAPGGVADLALNLDTRATIPVYLVVTPGARGSAAHSQHWRFQYAYGASKIGEYPVVRLMHLTQEAGYDHLTNWGAFSTASVPTSPPPGVSVLVRHMSADERRAFEAIADETRVRVPDGRWNCQDWCITVMEGAVQRGIVSRAEAERVVREARAIVPIR